MTRNVLSSMTNSDVTLGSPDPGISLDSTAKNMIRLTIGNVLRKLI